MTGSSIGHYRVLQKLGEGGMGEVFLAEDERLGRKVALKLLPAALASDVNRIQRFEQEARAVSGLNHPNILTLFDLGRVGDRYFMATEYIEGRTLRAHLAERGRLPLAEAIGIARQCASALASAHAAGIVHRDIKPENVMLRHDGYVKVLDFGLAKVIERSTPDDVTAELQPNLTSAGVVLGTVGYLSPEQARGLIVDARTDVFSLGVMLYEMLAGARPFAGATPTDVLAAILREQPAPIATYLPDAPPDLEHVLDRMLAKDRDARYASADVLGADLERLAGDLAFDTHPRAQRSSSSGASGATAPSPARRYRPVLIASLVAITAIALWFGLRDRASGPAGAATSVAQIRTLAVLPFKLLGYPAESEHLGLGMADALIVKLTNLRQLTVRPTTAVTRYQSQDQDADAAGRALQVEAVLTGNVQRAGGRVRVTVQLVGITPGGSAGRSIWSDEFTALTDDPFEVQDQLTARLVQKLAIEISGDERSRLAKQGTSNPRARERYMEARFFVSKRTPAGYQRALELFTAAIREDAGYAEAHLGQAVAWTTLIEFGGAPKAETLVKAHAALARALELDPALGEAYALRGQLARVFDLNFPEADRDSLRSMELDPTNPMVLQWRGVHLLSLGRAREAVSLHRRSTDIDPVDLSLRSQLARALYFARDYEEAVRTARALIDLDNTQSSAYQWMGLSHVELGRADEGLSSLQQAVKLTPGQPERQAALAYAYARAGRQANARAMIAELERAAPGVGFVYHIATVEAGLGNTRSALRLLERARQERDAYLANRVLLDPKLDTLRNTPEFRALLKTLGLDGR